MRYHASDFFVVQRIFDSTGITRIVFLFRSHGYCQDIGRRALRKMGHSDALFARRSPGGPVKFVPCHYEMQLCLLTLVATRGRAFPIARITDRLRCPNCGDMKVMVALDIPGGAVPMFQPIRYGRGG